MKFVWRDLTIYIQFKHKTTKSKRMLTVCKILHRDKRLHVWGSGTSEGLKNDEDRDARLQLAVKRASEHLSRELRGLVLSTFYNRRRRQSPQVTIAQSSPDSHLGASAA